MRWQLGPCEMLSRSCPGRCSLQPPAAHSCRYLCSGLPPLQGLYRTAGSTRAADFMGRDFRNPVHATAAAKNAYVLLGQHRYQLAAAFFILGEIHAILGAAAMHGVDTLHRQ